MLLNRDKVCKAAFLLGAGALLILISVGYATTNDGSRAIIIVLRYISGACVLGSILAMCLFCEGRNRQIVALMLYSILIIWAALMSVVNGAWSVGSTNLLINILVTSSAIAIFAWKECNVLPVILAKFYLLYVFFILGATMILGGLNLDFPPHFIFEYSSSLKGGDILYSQGVSKFYGFGAIASLFLVAVTRSRWIIYFFSFLVFVFLVLSLLGGARGDSVAAMAIVFGYALFKWPRYFIPVLLALAAIIYYMDLPVFDGFVIFQRLSAVIDGDAGQRDVFIIQSIDLLADNPRCMLVGCGVGFFQTYYGYEYGNYPHNLFAELLIIFGLPFSIFISAAVLRGIYVYWCKVGRADLLLMFFLYSLLLALKSGDLLGGWFVVASCMYFASLSMGAGSIRKNENFTLNLSS